MSWTMCACVRCDLGSASEVKNAAAAFGMHGPITNVLHASGVLRNAVLAQQGAAHIRDVYAPKARGGELVMQVCKLTKRHSVHICLGIMTPHLSVSGAGSCGAGHAARCAVQQHRSPHRAGRIRQLRCRQRAAGRHRRCLPVARQVLGYCFRVALM